MSSNRSIIERLQQPRTYGLNMTDEALSALVNEMKGEELRPQLRKEAHKTERLSRFLISHRFLMELAKQTNCLNLLPPSDWIDVQAQKNGHFLVDGHEHTFHFEDYVFDKTRHGFAELDMPVDLTPGVIPKQDLGGCVADVDIRNVFILANLNHPIHRIDPLVFCQRWVLTAVRPKFVFRGMLACPKGDYGMIRIIFEVVDTEEKKIRNELSIVFKKNDETKTGKFIPFEVTSPEYTLRPTQLSVNVMAYHVNCSKHKNPGFRFANCTIQCQMPEKVHLFQNNTETLPEDSIDAPVHFLSFITHEKMKQPEYVKILRKKFNSVIENAKTMKDEEDEWKMEELEDMMEEQSLEDEELEEEEQQPVRKARRRVFMEDKEGFEPSPSYQKWMKEEIKRRKMEKGEDDGKDEEDEEDEEEEEDDGDDEPVPKRRR